MPQGGQLTAIAERNTRCATVSVSASRRGPHGPPTLAPPCFPVHSATPLPTMIPPPAVVTLACPPGGCGTAPVPVARRPGHAPAGGATIGVAVQPPSPLLAASSSSALSRGVEAAKTLCALRDTRTR